MPPTGTGRVLLSLSTVLGLFAGLLSSNADSPVVIIVTYVVGILLTIVAMIVFAIRGKED